MVDTNCYGLIVTPIPHLPVLLRKEELEESGVKEKGTWENGKNGDTLMFALLFLDTSKYLLCLVVN